MTTWHGNYQCTPPDPLPAEDAGLEFSVILANQIGSCSHLESEGWLLYMRAALEKRIGRSLLAVAAVGV